MNRKIKISFDDSRCVEVDYKAKAGDVVKLVENDISDVLGLKINNEVKDFDYELVRDSKIEYIKYKTNRDGYLIYSRTLKMILYMALTSLYSNVDIEFIATINKDQYFVANNLELTENKLKEIK